ncbi:MULTISPECIES: hypothetical protein [unclassified Guyparkeria]|uniref:hypothetical protein n=1 Tax=unclassified Guyparkeria TaxID=2626246 RepID=UPI0007336B41|nr:MULTISPECIES: hypothetical protein [unclassified Guyparkeria]KTG17595.1 hypothetical protein AUR63_08055 [Guyparkeria sp. XI15]OAE88408.1 hypothetical protein AWR35_08070 [Guyparkeria sp. WRN-7]
MRLTTLSTLLATMLATGAAHAGHANPWATPEDDLLMQYHEENLEQSEDTPGEDEMLGVMDRNAYGKLGGSPTTGGGMGGGPGVGGGNPGVGGGH